MKKGIITLGCILGFLTGSLSWANGVKPKICNSTGIKKQFDETDRKMASIIKKVMDQMNQIRIQSKQIAIAKEVVADQMEYIRSQNEQIQRYNKKIQDFGKVIKSLEEEVSQTEKYVKQIYVDKVNELRRLLSSESSQESSKTFPYDFINVLKN